jgi:hypothetical protein
MLAAVSTPESSPPCSARSVARSSPLISACMRGGMGSLNGTWVPPLPAPKPPHLASSNLASTNARSAALQPSQACGARDVGEEGGVKGPTLGV